MGRFAKRKTLVLAAAALTGSALGAKYAWRRFIGRDLPPPFERLTFTGLQRPVEVLRDKWGVPHIYARSKQDLFFAQGFVHAQDRLFQMDAYRRVGLGRLSEIVGPAGLATDRVARYYGWSMAVEALVRGADEQVRRLMGAYAAGINAYIAQKPLPPEFTLLHYRPEPWDLASTAAIGTVLAWGLSSNWETELLRLILADSLGPEKAVDLTPLAEEQYLCIVPDVNIDAGLVQALLDAYRVAMKGSPVPSAAAGRGGSNNWVVSGDHTASGRPILANDPHLPPTYPALWYENHLSGGDYQVTGFTMPGVPGVVIGHNNNIAWGFTNAFPDIQDIYVERFHPTDHMRYEVNGQWQQAEVRLETIKIRGCTPRVERVRYTRHGPVFSDLLPDERRDLALRWTGHNPHNHLRAVLDMNLAGDWKSFQQALTAWGFPSQNVVYADISGTIAYVMPGKVPLRKTGSGLAPVPGWKDDFEWQGWIPRNELPTLHNPGSGRIVTANNRVQGPSYPYLLTGEWLPDYRARRIDQLLASATDQTLETHARIQSDTVSLQARRFLALALPAVAGIEVEEDLRFALNLLRVWDGDMRAGIVAPTIYTGWLVHFSQLAVRQAVGPDVAARLFRSSPPETFQINPFLELALDLALQWLQEGPPDWVHDVRPLLLPALRKTMRLLRRRYGKDPQRWLWGKLHQIKNEHPLARVPVLGRSWRTGPIPAGGDGFTVNQAQTTPHFPPREVEIIASCRMILDVGAWDNSLAALPGGESGNPASPYYADGLTDWRGGRYHPMLFSRARVTEATKAILVLAPPDVGAPANNA